MRSQVTIKEPKISKYVFVSGTTLFNYSKVFESERDTLNKYVRVTIKKLDLDKLEYIVTLLIT